MSILPQCLIIKVQTTYLSTHTDLGPSQWGNIKGLVDYEACTFNIHNLKE